MGILKLFAKASPEVQRLPHGSLTLDRDANVLATTIPSAFGAELLQAIGGHIVGLFREARKAQMPLNEINLHFASFQITAREMRGGAVIFLKPKDLFLASPQN